jgi:hypothetical protein
LLLLLVGGFYFYWMYYNVYGNGERKGTLIKITKRGNVFKTVEGEMWLSCRQTVNAEKFYFTIVDKVVADSIEKMQDECVQVTYKQYRKPVFWRGDNEYIVTGFQAIK